MQIKTVKMKNFRCFKEAEVDFQKCHALVGENGSGKTATLEGIQMATSAGQTYLHEQDFNNADLGNLTIEVIFDEVFLVRLPDGYTTQDIPCQSILLSAHRREKAAPGKALSEPFVVEKYAVPIEYDAQHVPVVATSETTRIPATVRKTASGYEAPRQSGSSFKFTNSRLTLQNETINLPDVFYFDRDREEQTKVGFNSLLQKVAKDLNWRYRKNWSQADVAEKWNAFYDAVISTVEDPKAGRIIQPIRDKMKRIAGVDFSNLELGLMEIEQPFSRTFFSRRDQTNQIEQKRFGSGISILLAYFLLETISSFSKEKIIFLIDEPELHLHPQLQEALYREFVGSPFQTIYSTQSDCLINIAEWRSVSRFHPDFKIFPKAPDLAAPLDGKKLREHLDEIKAWHQHKSIFFREDNQIFFARKCVLVEGPAEKYGLPIIAEKLGKEFQAVTIISCNGKSKIPYYQLLCKSFGIPFFTVLDLDGVRESDGENKRPCEWADASARHAFATSFEDEFGITGGSAHKISELFNKIDAAQANAIPVNVVAAINAIVAWS